MPDTMTSLPIVQCAAKVDTLDEGTIILIMSQYAEHPQGKTIHSKSQLEDFGCIVHDTPRLHGGQQSLITPEGYVIPMHLRGGLHFIDMTPPTDEDLEKYPHVFITSDAPWDPTTLSDTYHPTDALPLDPAIQERRDARGSTMTNDGNISFPRLINQAQSSCYDDCYIDYRPGHVERLANALHAYPQNMKRHFDDLDLLQPNFAWISPERIQHTLELMTQFYRAANYYPFRKHFRSRFPAANVRRLPEWFSMDTYFAMNLLPMTALLGMVAASWPKSMVELCPTSSSLFLCVLRKTFL